MKQLTSRTINWLRVALVILVLFVHVHPAVAAIAYLAEIALIMTVGIMAYWLLRRFLPRLSGIITGGR